MTPREPSALIGTLDASWAEFHHSWRRARRRKPGGVHNLRVTSRRLVAALDFLDDLLGHPAVSQLRRRLKQISRRLGPLRDLHVQLAQIPKLPQSLELKQFQRFATTDVAAEGDRLHHFLDKERWRKLDSQWTLVRREVETRDMLKSEGNIRKVVRALLQKRVNHFRRAVQGLDLEDKATVHTVRIAARKLRYAQDCAHSLFNHRRRIAAGQLLTAQRELGALRDLELFRKRLRGWSESRGGRTLTTVRASLGRESRSRLKKAVVALDGMPL